MADEGSRPAKGSWKGLPKESRSSRKPTHEWNRLRTKPAHETTTKSSRTLRIAGGLTALAACVGCLIYLILIWRPPKPAAVVLVGADYATNLAVPHNVLGWRGLKGIEAVSKTPPRFALFNPASLQLIQGGPIVLNLSGQWKELIEDLNQRAREQSTLLLVLELHGGSSAEGAYLIPNEASGAPDDRLELKTVIESMKQLPAGQNKVLVLEGAQIASDWRWGFLHNDFARWLEELEPEIARVPNLWVLSGAEVDQRCWSSEGLGRTAFSHFLIQALRGEAAGADRRLTLAELHEYVRKNVRDWVWNARGAVQEPVLLPRDRAGSESDAKGKGSARRSASAVYLASVEAAPPPEPVPAPDRATLEQVWNKYQALDGLTPHPSVYSPRRWGEYRALLVRDEELLRAGAAGEEIARIEARIEALASALERERYLLKLPESAQNNLVMSVVQGATVEALGPETEAFQRFWNPPPNLTAAQVWAELKNSNPDPDATPRQPYRCLIDDLLINRASRDSFNSLATAAARLKAARDSEYPQPAESHFLIMLDKYLTPRRDKVHPGLWGRVNRAIRLRRLAERTALGIVGDDPGYPRGEEVYPWIKTLVDRADEARRLGEDRLFTSEESAWTQADALFTSAERLYSEASERAAAARSALDARDRVLANLPDYSQWLAHRHPDDLLKDDRSAALEELWSQTHQLVEQLGKPGDETTTPTLRRLEQSVSAGYQQLLELFAGQRNLVSRERLREDEEVAAAAVAVPFADPRLRNLIWDRLDAIQDHDREAATRPTTAKLTDKARREALQIGSRRAQLQGLLSLNALGKTWFDEPGYDDRVTFDQARQWVTSSPPETESESEPWWKELARAGDSIGSRWRNIAPEVDDRLMSDDVNLVNPRDLADHIERADRLGRFIDSGSQPLPESKPEAAGVARRQRVHDLLVWLADRAWKDHWFAEDENAVKPYYRAAGLRFANDADKLALKTPDPEAARMKEVLSGDGRLKINGPDRLVLTTEAKKDVAFQVAAEGDEAKIPPGLPVIKPIVEGELGLEGESDGFRPAPWRTGGETARFTVFSPLIRGAESDAKLTRPLRVTTKLTVEGIFRGQHFSKPTEVELYPLPDQWVVGPPPPENTAKVAVRADGEVVRQFGEGTGSIAIVLDCSGSMNELTGDGISKFAHAKQAIVNVLERVVPRGTTVSLWTFSQLPEGVQLVNGQVPLNDRTQPLFDRPELTIHRLLNPAKWYSGEKQALLAQLDGLTPCFYTPLVEAMWKAATTDLPASKKGMKTLLVLTDGMDTRFGQNPDFFPGVKGIPEFIPKFNELGVRVNMVFFSSPLANQNEIVQAKANFEKPLAALNPAGTFVTANDRIQLERILSQLLRQELVCQVLRADGSMLGDGPIRVTVPPAQDEWSAPADTAVYKLRVVADRTYQTDIDLRKGDRLVVKLVGDSDGIRFERALFSDDFRSRTDQEQAGWRLANLAAEHDGQGPLGRLALLTALEKLPSDSESGIALHQIYPGLAWFKLDGRNLQHPEELFTTRWRERRSQPAPVWSLDVPRWPGNPAGKGPAVPLLTAWWLNPDQKPAAAAVFKINAGASPGDPPAKLQIDENAFVEIEDVSIERHRVEVGPDTWKDNVSCLVVRLAYPRDKPCFVDPGELNGIADRPTGYEHRFFSRANKYTGVFWPVNQGQLEQLKSLSVISLAQVRALAKKQGTTAQITIPAP